MFGPHPFPRDSAKPPDFLLGNSETSRFLNRRLSLYLQYPRQTEEAQNARVSAAQIFDGFVNSRNFKKTQRPGLCQSAGNNQSVYRARTACQEVEDNLAALRILENEAQQQDQAVASSKDSLHLFTNRYNGGIDTLSLIHI